MTGDSLEWFASYLSSRMQSVRLQGSSSGWGPVCAGVPQGSILGPLLFSVCVNDLPTVTHDCQLNMYADDICLLHSTVCRVIWILYNCGYRLIY